MDNQCAMMVLNQGLRYTAYNHSSDSNWQIAAMSIDGVIRLQVVVSNITDCPTFGDSLLMSRVRAFANHIVGHCLIAFGANNNQVDQIEIIVAQELCNCCCK